MSSHALSLTLAVLLLGGAGPVAAASDPLAPFAWQQRVLLVAAGSTGDPRFIAQKTIFVGMGAEARARDLVLVEAVGEMADAQALRRRFDLAPGVFQVLLIGKDGGEKLRSATPVDAGTLFPLIDAMPMRRSEMQRRP